MSKFIFLFILLMPISKGISGVIVDGTKFIIDKDSKSKTISLKNDNESDYIIKIDILENDKKSNDFIISPPLMHLKKNQSNSFSILYDGKQNNEDKLYKLSITAIPNSKSAEKNSISFAMRSNFNLIKRHDNINFNKINVNDYLIMEKVNDTIFSVKNISNYAITFEVESDIASQRNTLGPHRTKEFNNFCKKSSDCKIRLMIIDDFGYKTSNRI